MKIEVLIKTGHLKIYLNSILHLSINAQEIIGIETYDSHEKYYINYHTKTRSIETYYISESTWKEILKQIDKLSEL